MPHLTLRWLATGALAMVGALAAAALVGWLAPLAAVALAALAVASVLVGAATVGGRRLRASLEAGQREHAERIRLAVRRERDQLRRQLDEVAALAGGVAGSWPQDRGELLDRLDQLGARLSDLDGRVAGLERVVEQLPAALIGPMTEAVTAAGDKRNARLHWETYARVAAHADLLALMSPRAPMPPLGGWALDADVLQAVVALLYERRIALVVECGSGSSSIWLGYLLERLGTGRVVALEHDERYLRTSDELVRVHALCGTVEIRHAPLRPWAAGDQEYRWYAPAAWEPLDGIGLLLVDGPPGATGPQARYPAGPLLFPRCVDDAVIVLDDANRGDERQVSERWLAEYPWLTRTKSRLGSAHVFRRTAPGRAGRSSSSAGGSVR